MKPGISVDLAQILMDKWIKAENHFVSSSKKVFHMIRNERFSIVYHFSQIRKDYITFLNRPDNFQEKVDLVTKSCNDIDIDMRDDPETKQELHQRAEDLKEALWELSDKRRDESEEERKRIMKDGWIDDHLTILLNNYITLMQIEVDRYLESRQLIVDYHKGMKGEPLDILFRPVDLPFVGSSLKFRPPSLVVLDKKKKKQPTSAASTKSKNATNNDPFPELSQTVEKALSLIPQEHMILPTSAERSSPVHFAITEQSSSHNIIASYPIDNEELAFALRCEDDILRARIHAIRAKGLSVLTGKLKLLVLFYIILFVLELRANSEKLYVKLDEWLGQRFRMEVTNIEKVCDLIKTVAETETKFPHLLIQR